VTKTIAIFGAGSGLGTSVARRFGAQDYRVALVARRLEPLQRLTDTLAAEGIETAPFTADLADEDAAVAVLGAIRERLGRIDVLYYRPSASRPGSSPRASCAPARCGICCSSMCSLRSSSYTPSCPRCWSVATGRSSSATATPRSRRERI
jgi:hypothetical protein